MKIRGTYVSSGNNIHQAEIDISPEEASAQGYIILTKQEYQDIGKPTGAFPQSPEPKKIEKLCLPIVITDYGANWIIQLRDKINEIIDQLNGKE